VEAAGDDNEILSGLGRDERASNVSRGARDTRDVGVGEVDARGTRRGEHGFDGEVRGETGLRDDVHASRGPVDVGDRFGERELVGRALEHVREVERQIAQLGRGEPLQRTDEGHKLHATSLGRFQRW